MILQSWLFLLISAETILGYCSLNKEEYTAKVKFIREGFEKRVRRAGQTGLTVTCYPQLYREEPTGNLAEESEICACRPGLELMCAVIQQVPVKPCNTDDVFYSHHSPYYSPYRGGCVCYSGDFICAKEDYTKGFKRDQIPTGELREAASLTMIPAAPEPLDGVHLFMGYSRKDAKVLMEGRQKVSDRVASTEEEEQEEVLSTVQQAVSYFTSNNNKVREKTTTCSW